jgi:hypothetical protein
MREFLNSKPSPTQSKYASAPAPKPVAAPPSSQPAAKPPANFVASAPPPAAKAVPIVVAKPVEPPKPVAPPPPSKPLTMDQLLNRVEAAAKAQRKQNGVRAPKTSKRDAELDDLITGAVKSKGK